jgi:hypothetical protein
MAECYNIKDYIASKPDRRPREITFYGHSYLSKDSCPGSINLSVRLEDGGVEVILATVIEMGGYGLTGPDGIYRWVPWPCAAVEIRDV